ncbi:MAG: hypothetical protein LBT91_03170 [Bifidobacteriaceae bacterium]|jgi:hypothetical protein|nr:hypothetical protein [Bifidobacteriaceae bacterium]
MKLTILNSALKHGFTEFDIINTMKYPIAVIETEKDDRCFVGWSLAGVPIEVLVETRDNHIIVYHCQVISSSVEKMI